MFNPSTYNVTAAAGSVNMTYSYSGTAYEPSFSWSGNVNVTNTTLSATYTVEDELSPNSVADRNNFVDEMYSYGVPRNTTNTLIDVGYITLSDQEEAESLMEVLTYVATEITVQYGTVGVPDVTAEGTLAVTYGANSTANQLSSTVTVDVDEDLEGTNVMTFSGTLNQASSSAPGTIDITGDPVTLDNDETYAYYFISTSGVDSVSVSFNGDLSIQNYTITPYTGGYQLNVDTNANSTTAMQTTTITVTGTLTGGGAISDTTVLSKKGLPGTITLSPSSATVSRESGNTTSTITATRVSSLTAELVSGTSVTSQTILGSSLVIVYGANSSGSTITNTVRVKGTDNFGDEITALFTLTQLGVDPSLSVSPSSKAVMGNQTSTTFTISAEEVSSLSASSSDSWITDCQISGSTLTVTFTRNPVTSSPRTGTITVTGTSSLGTTLTYSITITQRAVPGQIVISPSTYTTDGAAETKVFSVQKNGISNIQTSDSGDISFTSITLSGTQLTVVMPANNSHTTKTSTITLTGTDGNGDTKTKSVTITQRTIPTITFGETSRTLNPTETTAYYPLRVYNVESPTVSISGTVSVDHYTFTQDQSDSTLYQLYVYTNNNTGSSDLTSTITVSGTSELGTSASDTATLIKKGVAGSITLNPTTASVSAAAGTTSSTISTSGITSVLSTEFWGSGGVTTVTNASVSGNTLTVTYGANSSVNTVTNYVKVSGTDSNGDTQFATMTIIQAASSPSASITVTPSSKTVSRNETYATFTITTSGTVNNLMMTTTDFWIIDYLIQNGVLSVSFAGNNGPQRTATLTVLGTDSGGNEVSTSVTLIQEGTGTAGSITINPDSRTLQATESQCMYVVTYQNMQTPLTVSHSGTVNVTDYHLDAEDFGYYLWVTTANNTGSTDLSSTFTVSGTDTNGVARSATCTLTKKAPSGITITPGSKTVSYQAGTTTFTVTSVGITSELSLYYASGDMNIISATLNDGTITVVYGANSAYVNKSHFFVVNGTDADGNLKGFTATLVQENAPIPPSAYTFAFNPTSQSTRTVSLSQTSLMYSVDSYKSSGTSSGGYVDLQYNITSIQYTSGTWSTDITISYDGGVPYLVIPMNTTNRNRTAVAHFVQYESNLEITSTITQESGGSSQTNFLPIWQDDVYTASANDFIEYHITLGSDIIYAGKAYKYPDASNIRWSINDVCSNYIGTDLTFTSGIQRIPNYCKTFTVATNQSVVRSSRFYNSWAYKDTTYWLSDPIDYRVDPRQWLPVSFLSSNSRNITVGGTSYTASAYDDGWTVMTNLSGLTLNCGGSFTVTPGIGSARQYQIDCGDFVLYYANAYGGWDALLVKGTTKKTDNIEHMNYRRKSSSLSDFSKINYQNNITPTWSLNTGITVDGSKMYHLLESVKVYLHNLKTNEIIPVVITNAQCEYLNYTNNGKKPYYYNITVEESNLKLRK